MPIYTKTGDAGETALFGGTRVSKDDPLINLYGSVDELNSWLGLVLSGIADSPECSFLLLIQEDLFRIGAHLSGSREDLTPVKARVTDMEGEIDRMESNLKPLNTFIIPGGSQLASWMHIARSVTRRVERIGVSVRNMPGEIQRDMDTVIIYLNRLSDYLFVLARYTNAGLQVDDVPWKGAGSRKN